jgi:hypothetical protein
VVHRLVQQLEDDDEVVADALLLQFAKVVLEDLLGDSKREIT